MCEIPIRVFSSHNKEKTGIYNFDLRREINVAYPATSPNLLASFIVVHKGDTVSCVQRKGTEYLSILNFLILGAYERLHVVVGLTCGKRHT